ncbi:hypothetical protein BTZ20_3107 [Rhodococcus sp. MTM3W5.2]|nr:hypothetical protein BTZ20_3107 [Rhodococcus sp. MTM3W5.2]
MTLRTGTLRWMTLLTPGSATYGHLDEINTGRPHAGSTANVG